MAILNLRQSPPSESSGGEPGATGDVESVREMLESGEPPGLDRIRRFVVKPRPRLWKFGVGIWLWVVRIGQWLVRLVRWIARQSVRLMRAVRLAAFAGRRAQNLGARIGAVGRNWSSAEGRLGALGGRLVGLGGGLIAGGAALAQAEAGVTELTRLAARFVADAPDAAGAEAHPAPAPPTEGAAPPRSRRSGRRAAAARPGPRVPAAERAAPPARGTEGSPKTAPAPAVPAGRPEPRASDSPPTAGRTVPPALPDDLPFYVRNQIEHLGGHPRRETVEHLILALTEERGWLEPGQLAAWLGMTAPHLKRRYLGPMTKAGALVRRYPDRPTHPEQAYRSALVAEAPRR